MKKAFLLASLFCITSPTHVSSATVLFGERLTPTISAPNTNSLHQYRPPKRDFIEACHIDNREIFYLLQSILSSKSQTNLSGWCFDEYRKKITDEICPYSAVNSTPTCDLLRQRISGDKPKFY